MDTMTRLMPERDFLAICRQNVNVFAAYVLRVKQAPLQLAMQDHMIEHDDAAFMLPRGHTKTTQSVISMTHTIGNDIGYRFKYIMQNNPEAKKTVRLAKQIMESEEYRRVFPWVIPDMDLWGSSAIAVKRPHFTRDATVEAVGVFGRASGRADCLVFDDICDLRNSIQQPKLRNQVMEAVANTWLPMIDQSSPRRKMIRKFFTPYHIADQGAKWKQLHGEDGSLFFRPVRNMISPWPEAFTVKALQRMRDSMGPIAFSRAYELVAISGAELIFRPAWLDKAMYESGVLPRFVELNSTTVASIDWAFTEENAESPDPDWSVCLVGKRDNLHGDVWPTGMLRKRCSYLEFKDEAIQFCVDHGVEFATAEGEATQSGLVQQMNRDAPFPVVAAPRPKGKKDKVTRATARQAFVESGRLHLPGVPAEGGGLRVSEEFEALYDEMTTFPASEHDDTVDACMDMLGPPEMDGGIELPSTVHTGRRMSFKQPRRRR